MKKLILILIVVSTIFGCVKSIKPNDFSSNKGKKHQIEQSAILPATSLSASGNVLTWTLPANPKWTMVQKSPTLPVAGDSTTTGTSFYQVQWAPNYVTSTTVESGFYYRVSGTDMNDDVYISNTVFIP